MAYEIPGTAANRAAVPADRYVTPGYRRSTAGAVPSAGGERERTVPPSARPARGRHPGRHTFRWACSAAGSAPARQAGGRRFECGLVHHVHHVCAGQLGWADHPVPAAGHRLSGHAQDGRGVSWATPHKPSHALLAEWLSTGFLPRGAEFDPPAAHRTDAYRPGGRCRGTAGSVVVAAPARFRLGRCAATTVHPALASRYVFRARGGRARGRNPRGSRFDAGGRHVAWADAGIPVGVGAGHGPLELLAKLVAFSAQRSSVRARHSLRTGKGPGACPRVRRGCRVRQVTEARRVPPGARRRRHAGAAQW
jgi:hypothetical protein